MKIRSLKVNRGRRGFTLVEIMVVMTIIAILIAILVPAVGMVRETARGSQCRASLRQFYLGMAALADRDKVGHYTTGAFDPSRDGCPDSIGWVADMVNAKVCKPQELLCPSNPCQGSEKYKDIFSDPTSASGENAPLIKQNLGACGLLSGAMTGTAIADNFLAKGYGTNHASTWFMVRSMVQTTGTAGSITAKNYSVLKGLGGSKGPLTRRMVDQSTHTANTVPMMMDAQFGDVKDRFLDADIIGSDGTVYLIGGSPLAESFSDGPYQRDPMTKWGNLGTAPVIFSQTGADPTTATGIWVDENPRKGVAKKMNLQLSHLQDYRDFGPVHGGSANVLFADGSVKAFSDSNGDSRLNPGFNVPSGQGPSFGYQETDTTVELPEAEIFSGAILENLGTTSKQNED